MRKNGKYLVRDVIKLIDEFLAEEIDLADVKAWLKDYLPAKKDRYTTKQRVILSRLKNLTQKPINVKEWQRFRDCVKEISVD